MLLTIDDSEILTKITLISPSFFAFQLFSCILTLSHIHFVPVYRRSLISLALILTNFFLIEKLQQFLRTQTTNNHRSFLVLTTSRVVGTRRHHFPVIQYPK